MDAKHINALIRLADKLDQEKKFDLAGAVDGVLRSKAARPKAPLKGLNDDVKKSLIVFLVDAEDAMHNGCKGLGELSRRMRYFDIADAIKELGLDKVIKDMERTQECLDSAKKDFYTMTFGKRPSKSDFEKLRKDLGKDEANDDESQAALDFFSSDQAIDSPNVNLKQDLDEEEMLGAFRAGPGGVEEVEPGEEEQYLPDPDEEEDALNKSQWGPDDDEDFGHETEEISQEEMENFWLNEEKEDEE